MTAWRLGIASASKAPVLAPQPATGAQNLIDGLTKWIPGDVLALYVAGVSALSANDKNFSLGLLITATVLAPLFVLLGAWSAGHVTRRAWVTAAFAGVAFIIWSVTVPLSWWQSWDPIASHKAIAALGAGALASLLSVFFDGAVNRLH